MNLRAFIVSVDFSDILDVTLAYNKHHFGEIYVITSLADDATRAVCRKRGACPFSTNSFYDNGADFNKWKALELGLDHFGRHGIICLMDADVLWPKTLPDFRVDKGMLYSPYRRMYNPVKFPLPEEYKWKHYPRHRNVAEFAGYSQIFHADDPHLGAPPWHEINWRHAGGADSFFQRKWPATNKIRPGFEVLHLGPAGTNWTGRVTPHLDGSAVDGAEERKAKLLEYMSRRRRQRRSADPYSHEKLEG